MYICLRQNVCVYVSLYVRMCIDVSVCVLVLPCTHVLESRVWQLEQTGCAVFKVVPYDRQFRKQQKPRFETKPLSVVIWQY